MSRPYCEKHRRYGRTSTSPKFVAAAKSMQPVSRADIRHIQINLVDRSYQVPVDADFFEQLGFPANLSMVILKDRDKSSNQLNDRVLVVKIRHALGGVCRDCLDEVLPRD